MGHLKNKYTKEYFTGKNARGKKLKYGATSILDKNGNYVLRENDSKILNKIDFSDKKVLCLGCGRGEEIVYAIEKGAKPKDIVGVDFSSNAIEIARDLIKSRKFEEPQFYIKDALDFVSKYKEEKGDNQLKEFDIVIMFDFVEHVPRKELENILEELKLIISEKAILIINTPAYKYDNDVIKDGYNDKNEINSMDTSDLIPETQGMHCNKYSLVSLQMFMNRQGFINVTEAHFFINKDSVFPAFENISFLDRWNSCSTNGYPFCGEYQDDNVESPYPEDQEKTWVSFNEGVLEGISLYTTETYKNLAYPNGNTDKQMMDEILSINPSKKTIFDVGAFVSASSMVFSKLVGSQGKVFSFEPNPFNRNRCFKNLSHNPVLSSNIQIYPYALGKENEKQKMTLSSEIDNGYSSTSRLNESHAKLHNDELPEGFEELDVEVKTLDTIVRELNVVPDILKVDIEGAEFAFLLGSIGIIRKYKPIFFIEIHSEFCAIMCSEVLTSEGYTITILNEEKDNRIMIKAEYDRTNKKKTVLDREYQSRKNLDVSFNLLRTVENLLELSKKEIEKINGENKRTLVENIELKKAKEELQVQINNYLNTNVILVDENRELRKQLQLLENSKSWKMTKPLRRAFAILKKSTN